MTGIDTHREIGVIGAGTRRAGIAQLAARVGHPVVLFDAIDGAAKKAKAACHVYQRQQAIFSS